MDEAKLLTHMSVSAILSAMVLAAAIGLIGVGYTIWAYFSRQDAANQRMATYANYTAFDNTTVRGQEVISLLESDLDLFVIIYDGTSSDKTIDNMKVSSNPRAIYYSDVSGVNNFNFGSIQSTSNANTTCANALTRLKSLGNKTPSTLSVTYNLNNVSHSDLIAYFTDARLGKIAKDNKGNLINTGTYSAFKSTLVYAEDGTTDVVGIILVRASADVTSY